jgi:hypothetical protein
MANSYACTKCGRGFSRKSSAIRHVNKVETGHADVVPFSQYVAGIPLGLYLPSISKPPTYKKNITQPTQAEVFMNKVIDVFMEKLAEAAWQDINMRKLLYSFIMQRNMEKPETQQDTVSFDTMFKKISDSWNSPRS